MGRMLVHVLIYCQIYYSEDEMSCRIRAVCISEKQRDGRLSKEERFSLKKFIMNR